MRIWKLDIRKHVHNNRHNYKLDLIRVGLEKSRSSHFCMKENLFNNLPEKAWLVGLKIFEVWSQKIKYPTL